MQYTKYGRDGAATTATRDPIATIVETFERHGAVFHVNPDNGDFWADLDGLGRPPAYADAVPLAILELGARIKDYLALREVQATTQ